MADDIIIIFICLDKTMNDANIEQMIKPEQDSQVEKLHLLLPLNRKSTKFA